MHLTTFTDYTLRVLIAVAACSERELSTVRQISGQYGISRNHVIKVVHHLSRTGYLETVRGKGGGLRLAKPAADIRLGAVIRDAENGFDVVPCMRRVSRGKCVIEPACVLKRALKEAVSAFLDVIDGYTLADLIQPRRRLRGLLSVNP